MVLCAQQSSKPRLRAGHPACHVAAKTSCPTLKAAVKPPAMCRNIKTLFNFEPPATELEIRDASLQFVRKLSGFSVPSRTNEAAFELAVEEVAASARKLIAGLLTHAQPRTREAEAAKAKARAELRFGSKAGSAP
jgi:hypothetical protein